MAEVTRLVCDKCGTETGVGQYRLSTPTTGLTRTLALDLCEACAAPLAELEEVGRVVSTPKVPVRSAGARRPGSLRTRIMSQEELDELEASERVAQ